MGGKIRYRNDKGVKPGVEGGEILLIVLTEGEKINQEEGVQQRFQVMGSR